MGLTRDQVIGALLDSGLVYADADRLLSGIIPDADVTDLVGKVAAQLTRSPTNKLGEKYECSRSN